MALYALAQCWVRRYCESLTSMLNQATKEGLFGAQPGFPTTQSNDTDSPGSGTDGEKLFPRISLKTARWSIMVVLFVCLSQNRAGTWILTRATHRRRMLYCTIENKGRLGGTSPVTSRNQCQVCNRYLALCRLHLWYDSASITKLCLPIYQSYTTLS